ncbi:MAG: 2-amino-4-oxopentanoate thiolase subunit OrtB [Bacillota bacterium]
MNSYAAVMARRSEIMRAAVGIDYDRFETGQIGFHYQEMMAQIGYEPAAVEQIQDELGVGKTPLRELANVTELVRQLAPAGKGARILLKDEALNPSGSFKARRAAVSVYHAQQNGYPGVISATSGNYGAAVAAMAARCRLPCIVVQEVFDSRGVGQPEIIEKSRRCEAYGAEVIQLTVGPELFYVFLLLLEETGFFNASLYTPFAIAGIETLGMEIAREVQARYHRQPDMVVVTHAGGGNVTGTARGLRRCGCQGTQVVGVSVDLRGLHMASDRDFNRKSFTTGHTGFGVPFATWPDRTDVPRNAARPLRYLQRYVTVTQGEVFYATEMLAQLEGLERGPAGNTALAAAVVLAQELDRDQILVVQETEYTGAGKHPTAQLAFARQNGVQVRSGDPRTSVPGASIIIPSQPELLGIKEVELGQLRRSYLRKATKGRSRIDRSDLEFLAAEVGLGEEETREILHGLGVTAQ